MIKALLLILLVATSYAQTGSIQVTPITPTLWTQSSYLVSYFTTANLPSTSTFALNFTNTYIILPSGTLNTTATVNGASVTGANATCSAFICTLRLNRNVAGGSTIRFTIGSFTNPYFMRAQPITAIVTFNATYSETPSWSIPADMYSPMAITSNSLTQSDYGVGNTNVNYIFNFSVSMSPSTVQLSLTMPPQVSVGTLQTSLVYYGVVQYAIPVLFNNIIILTFNTTFASATPPQGFILLNISGLTNPQSMGFSSSFVLQILVPTLPGTTTTCSNCAVAQLSTSLLARSTVPGNIQTLDLFSSNTLIGQANNITIYSKLYASIPNGGIYQILLPASVRPVMPVYCASLYGFEMVSGGAYSCSYNSTNNAIYTNNFAFSGSGSVVLVTTIINPPDTTQANFYFQSFDAAGNMIGNSTTPYPVVASPLPLRATATKSNSQVQSSYRMTVNCTLGVALTNSNRIQVILPQASYNTSSITCSVGTNVPCNATIDPMSMNLTVTLTPPCSPCSVGTTFIFAIDGLTNPSFINSYSQTVIVQSVTNTGIIQTNAFNLNLSPSTLTISNYNRNGGSTVGSSYSMSFGYTVSNYVNQNGGMLIINFNQFDTYVNPVTSGDGSYQFPTSLTVTDPQNNQYSNSVTYYTNSTPNCVQQIAINICGGSNCAGSIIISGLRKSLNPLTALTQNIQINTVFGDSVSTSTFNAMQFNAARASRSLGLSLTNSVTTLNSNYAIQFTSSNIPFQSGLVFTFSSLHTINGGCFLTHNGTIFTGVFNCQVLNTSSVSLTYTGDATLMMLETITYSLSIINVANPISVVPLTYQLATQFSNTVNSLFTLTYAIQTPLPLNFIATKSNNTFGQSATINITVVSNYPTFNEIRMTAASSLITVLPSASSPTSYLSSMVNNAYQISQIYSLVNQSVILNIINPNMTGVTGNITFSMFNAGFLSATGNIALQSVVPMFLGLSASTTSRTVGDACNLTVTFLRVNSYVSESQFMLSLTSSLYDVSNAQYNGAPATFPISIPIGLTSIIITNLKNLLFIPRNSSNSGISAWTLDGSNAIVATTSFSAASLVPNTPAAAIGSSFTRTNTVINGVGSISINYTPRFPTVTAIMNITLPTSQSALVSPACSMQGSANNANTCTVLSSSTTSISLNYFNQTSTTLTNVVNIEPNNNLIRVAMFTNNNQLVQIATGTITPAIQFNQLSLSGTTTSAVVASANQVQLNIASPSPIDLGSKIVINFPNSTFIRLPALVSQDCSYTISGVSYTGCRYGYQGQWLTQVNLTAFGANQLPANTQINLVIFVTNAWSVTAFGAQAVTVLISNPSDTFVAQGSISLVTIFGGIPSLNAAAIGNANYTQLSSTANTNNSVTVSFTLPVSLSTGSTITLWLPKSAYSLSASNAVLVNNLQNQAQNSTYYSLTVTVTCSQSAPLCTLSGNQYSMTVPLQNNPFSQLQNNPIAFQVQLQGQPVSTQASLPLPTFTPQTLTTTSASISRSNLRAFTNTNVTIVVPNPNTVTSFTVMVSPLVKNTLNLPLVSAPTYAGLGNTQSLTYVLNSSNFLSISVSGAVGASSSITISGQNNLLVSQLEVYTVTIIDTNFIYFTGQVTPNDSLIPYSTGLNLQRITTTVATNTNIYLYGTLPVSIPTLNIAFNNNNYTISGSSFNVSLGSMINNNNVSDASTYPIVIRNNDYIAFSSNLPISPSLTPQTMTALIGVNIPPVVNVSSTFNITTSLTSTSLTYLSITTGTYFKALFRCCIDSACTQTFIKSCTLSTQNGNNFVELWLTSAQLVNNIVFQVVALDYQSTFSSQTLTVVSALPTSSVTVVSNISIAAANITASLSVLNWKVNSINTYTLTIQPIAKTGFLQIVLPSFIYTQLASNINNSSYTLTVNGSATAVSLLNQNNVSTLKLPVSPTSRNVVLLLTSIKNPENNFPYSFTVTQASDETLTSVYGYSKIGVSMNKFDEITIISAIRILTKVNVATNILMEATTPYASTEFVINFPFSQLVTGSSCTVLINQVQNAPCQVINNTAIMTSSLAGTNRYTINGLTNQKFYNVNNAQDLISAQIGNPYTKATTLATTTTFISPHLTLGSIVMNSMLSSSSVMLASTSLTYNITIENTNNIDGFLLKFNNYHYIFSPTLTCYINTVKISCNSIDSQTIFLAFPNPTTNQLIVTIQNLVNFIQPSSWTLKSVQTSVTNSVTSYSDVDLYFNDGATLAPFLPSSLAMRIILPFNYVQSGPVTFQAIIDSQFGSFLPINSLALNFTTHTSSCQLLSSPFVSTLSVTCTFSQSMNYNMKLQLYHSKFPNIPISVGSSNIFIYPTPGDGCSNQMCDSCSYANGQQYCFACRQGLYSNNGQCTGSCSLGSFPYSTTNICQPCSPTCSSCFGLYSTECLSCSNPSLALSSGTCVENCPISTYDYNKLCVTSEECTTASGCRLCSNTGFCYQCLPDYTGAPNCRYVNVMPATIMVYFIAPILGLAVISIIIAAAKCVGADSLLSQSIFSFSMVQLFAWAFTVPVMPNVMTAMVLVAFFTLRIIISIVSYEVFYKKNMGELSQKLLQEQSQKQIETGQQKKQQSESASNLHNWKTKLVRLTAHFNGPDSYELLKCKIAEPVLAVSTSLPIDAIFMANRWVVCILMFYMASVGTAGDSVLMPILVISNAAVVSLCRLLTWQKFRKCLSICKS